MRNPLRLLLFVLGFAGLVGIGAFAYAPGLDGFFVFDSVERVVRNDSLKIAALDADALVGAAYAAEAGYPQRGLSYVSFALEYYLTGGRFDPFVLKLTNLVIHFFNALLVAALAALTLARWPVTESGEKDEGRQGRTAVLACFAGAIWMLHPIQVTSVLYVIQRMTSLAGTCVLMGAVGYVLIRTRFERGKRYSMPLMYANVIVFTGIGFLFKQNALLLPGLIAVLEVFLFERRLAARRRSTLRWYFVITLLAPVLVGIALLASGIDSIGADYEARAFDAYQRVLTQARVLFLYLGLLLVPDIRRFGLFHDDVPVSTGIVEPWTTLPAVLGWVVIGILIVVLARRRAPWAFALCWFLVGHAAESSVLPLELVYEHRNYVPSVGIWIGVAFYAGVVWDRGRRLRAIVPYALAASIFLAALITHMRAETWRSPAQLMETLARYHPRSYRAASGYAFNAIARDADLGIRFEAFKRAAILNDDAVSPLIQMSTIAEQLAIYLAEHETDSSETPSASASIPLPDMRLAAESGHVAKILSNLDGEIARRLEHGVPRTGNTVALIGLVDCAVEGRRECVALREAALRWHASALGNTRLPNHLRAALELSTAKLYVILDEPDLAVEHARLAGRAAGDNLAYRLRETELYALLERWRTMGEALEDIARRFPVRAQADPAYRDLRARYLHHAADQAPAQ